MTYDNYLRVTLAPSASSLALISSASSLEAPSLRTLGAESTRSLASFSPRPVASRTTLITLTLLGPTSVSSTSNSVFSSAAAAPSPAAAATTTPAAADTPNSSSHALTKSFNSSTVNSLIASIIYCVDNFDILFSSIFIFIGSHLLGMFDYLVLFCRCFCRCFCFSRSGFLCGCFSSRCFACGCSAFFC